MKLVLTDSQKTLNAQQNVNFSVVSPVHFATNFVRQLQKKGLSPHTENKIQIKSVNCVSFVDHCVFVPTVPNVHSVVHAPPVGPPRSKSESGVNPTRGLCAPIQTQAPFSETPPDSQWLCQSRQKQVSEGGGSNPSGQKGSRHGEGSSISSFFQQTLHRPQTKNGDQS